MQSSDIAILDLQGLGVETDDFSGDASWVSNSANF